MGSIVCNDSFKIGIFIHNDEEIMDVLEDLMINFVALKNNDIFAE